MHILLVGKAFSGTKKYLDKQGYTFTELRDIETTKYPNKKFKNRVVCDFSNQEGILETVDKLNQKKPINGILTTYENYILPASRIAHHLSLPGLSEESARACTDKELMREAFSKAPEKISPAFTVINTKEQLLDFANQHSFPLIIKPTNLSKSLLVTKSNSAEELLANYQRTLESIDAVYKRYAPGIKPKLIVEEFLEGPIFSVDAFVDASGTPHVLENVVDYQTGYDIGFDDNFHYSRILPSRLPQNKIANIRHVAAIGCRALGMTSSPAHIEIILTKDGPRIVEIGARNGGYRERMHQLANGIDITKNAIALSLDQSLDIKPKKNDHVGVFELFPKNPGIFEGIENEEALKQLPSLKYFSIKTKKGEYAGKAGDGYKMCAVVILSNNNRHQFENDVSILNNTISVRTKLCD